MNILNSFGGFLWIASIIGMQRLDRTEGDVSSYMTNTSMSSPINNSTKNTRKLDSNQTPGVRLSKLLKWQRKPTLQNIQDKQFIQTRPRRPTFPFRLTPAALLIPAIPTLVGNTVLNKLRLTFFSSQYQASTYDRNPNFLLIPFCT